MNDVFSINIRAIKRIAYTMLAALLVVAGLPFFQPERVSADQMANRSIQMSDSAPSGGSITTGVGSGEGVTYRVSFDAVHEAGSMVIDFCGGNDTPILEDACTGPAGMDVTGASLVAVTGTVGTGDWDITAAGSQIRLATDTAGDNIGANSTQVFDIVGVTNPSTMGTFFARMYTFPGDNFGGYVDATEVNLDPNSDFGGIALSTAAVITITARVQENLTFCITNANPTTWTGTLGGGQANSCSADQVGDNPPSTTIGHTVGGTTLVLDSGTVDLTDGTLTTDADRPLFSQLSTNATNGAVINLRSNWACGGLSADGGATCAIPPVGDTPTIFTAGTAAFGLFVSDGFPNVASGNATGTITASGVYNDGVNISDTNPAALALGMDNTTATAPVGGGQASYSGSVSGTFGSMLASSPGPTYRMQNKYVFGATAALTTPAGIYTANMTMTATGTF